MTNIDLHSTSKRKEPHTVLDASPLTKRPRWEQTSGLDVASKEIGVIINSSNHASSYDISSSAQERQKDANDYLHQSTSTELASWKGKEKGKEKASEVTRDSSSEDLLSPYLKNKTWSIPPTLSKGKPKISTDSYDKQQRHVMFVDLTLEDTESENERPSTSLTFHKSTRKGTSQADAIDLTLIFDDDDDVIVIEPSPEPTTFQKHSGAFSDQPGNSENIMESDILQINEISNIIANNLPPPESSEECLRDIESDVADLGSTVQPDADITDIHRDELGNSPVETLVEGTLERSVSREASHDYALRSVEVKNEDLAMSLTDSILELRIDTTSDDDSVIKQEEQHSSCKSSPLSPEEIIGYTPSEKLPPKRAALVKEPDFSQISAEATEPVPDYNDRLSAAIKWPAEKLSTELHDMINRLPPHYLYNPHMKDVFEAVIEDNTAEDEPLSPKISIIGRKNGPVTPPWEFYYTNRIVYGEGVPRSNKSLLQGCDCIGPCDPKSKTCACVRRQAAWTGGEFKGFLYKKEKLMHLEYPVFECNDACECSEECMNRVVQHGRKHRISIVLTKNKGWGVIAEEKIPRGTYLGIYSGELILEAEADERGKLYDRFGRTYLFDVDFYHLHSLNNKDTDKGKDEERTNMYTIDAFHVGNFTRFLNHSCDPNCHITATYVNEPDVRKPALTIFTSREIQKGEEITFAYFGESGDDDRGNSDEELDDKTVKVGTGPSPHKKEAIYRRCLCGAANCRGQMF